MSKSILGYLIPCSGGKAVVLRQPKLFIGKRKAESLNATKAAPAVQHCALIFRQGVWAISRNSSPYPLKINGQVCDSADLKSGDIISLGPFRYRLQYPKSQENNDQKKLRETNKPSAPSEVSPSQNFGQLLPMGGGAPHSLHQTRITIGRKQDCDITLSSKQISGLHCGLEWQNGYWRVVDLGSQNGFRVNGIPRRRKWLFPGDVLNIVTYRFQIQYVPVGDPPEDEEDQGIKQSLLDKAGLKEQQIKSEPEEDEKEANRFNLFE